MPLKNRAGPSTISRNTTLWSAGFSGCPNQGLPGIFLKGALLLVAWRAPVLRATRDIDLLAKVSNDPDFVGSLVAEICETKVPEDGLLFDAASVTTERIAEDADYEGVRARFEARLATTRMAMQIDMGFSDVVTPAPSLLIIRPSLMALRLS
jgi:hypothetical protein